jgi:Fur family ferric uptake transcriptional regulator
VNDLDERHRHLARYVSSRGLKMTRQREVILQVFLEGGKHVSVEELLARVRAIDANIGHATLYRTMRLLVESGVASEHNFSDGATRYEPAEDPSHAHHDHLICTSCGAIAEFENPDVEAIQEQVAREHGYRLTHHRMELYGLCPQCLSRTT